jgi:hypothetical protein
MVRPSRRAEPKRRRLMSVRRLFVIPQAALEEFGNIVAEIRICDSLPNGARVWRVAWEELEDRWLLNRSRAAQQLPSLFREGRVIQPERRVDVADVCFE